LWKIVASSFWFRRTLYLPMLLAVMVSLALIGAADIVGSSFNHIVNREMEKYGTNVILTPEGEEKISEGIAVFIKTVPFRDTGVSLATANVAALLEMNPAWVVRGNGDILVGKSVAERFGLTDGSFVEIEKAKGRAAILDSGTDFDSFIVVNGKVEKPSLVLIRTDEPEQYRGKKAVILQEMVRTRYSFLESIRKLMLYVSVLSAIASMAAVLNLARMDAGARRKEFGILTVLGAFQRTIAKIIAAEFLVLACIAGLFGVLASLALSWTVLTFTAGVSPAMHPKTILYILAASLAAFSFTSLLYVFEASRHEVIENIRGE